MEPTQKNDSTKLKRSLQVMQNGLVIQFILGLAMGTIVPFDPATEPQPSVAHDILLVTHVLIGFLLLVGAVMILITATKRPGRRWTAIGWMGLGGIIAALAGGVLVILTPWSEFFIFVMGLGFIVSLVAYGYALRLINAPTPAQS